MLRSRKIVAPKCSPRNSILRICNHYRTTSTRVPKPWASALYNWIPMWVTSLTRFLSAPPICPASTSQSKQAKVPGHLSQESKYPTWTRKKLNNSISSLHWTSVRDRPWFSQINQICSLACRLFLHLIVETQTLTRTRSINMQWWCLLENLCSPKLLSQTQLQTYSNL